MSGLPRLLVVAPHATRSGSTKVLIALLRHLVDRGGATVAVRLLARGAMAEELEALGPDLPAGAVPAAVLVNSALAAGSVLDDHGGAPVALYLHESAEVLATLPTRMLRGLRAADVVLCVSDQIRADAIGTGVEPDRAVVLPPIIEPPSPVDSAAVAGARQALAIPRGAPLVLGCGEGRWNKGPDLFLEVARLLAPTGVRFAWAGRRQRALARQLDHDTRVLGLEGHVTWLGEVRTMAPWFALADMLLVPSRDDPQPLVPFEAAALDVPTAAWRIGGLTDLIDADAALGAPYPDIAALADQVDRGLRDRSLAAATVAAAQRWVEERQSPQVVAPRFERIVRDLIGRAAGTPSLG